VAGTPCRDSYRGAGGAEPRGGARRGGPDLPRISHPLAPRPRPCYSAGVRSPRYRPP